jgi:peptide/nickel transport system substrate-binding protein
MTGGLVTLATWALSSHAGTYRYAEDRAPAVVNPLFATSLSEARLDELVFEGLFADDPELRSRGRLCESFEVAPDHASMTLRLRRDVRWHDGEEFGADDVVFSVDAYRSPATASSEAGRVSWIKSATPLDPHTVLLTFVAPEFAPQDKLHFKILPAHRFTSPDVKRTDLFRTNPVGTGPYKLVSFNPDNSVALARAESHWAPAKIDELVLREISDKAYQAKLLLYESLEALVRVLPRDLAQLGADRKIELYPYQTNSWWYFGFNLTNPRFADVRVREALTRMVDVDGLLAPIGTGDRVSGPFVPSSPFYDHATPLVAYDPDAGAALLGEAGYTFVGDRWLGPDGTALTLQLVAPANLETAQDLVINVQSQLQRRGVVVEPVFVTAAEWKDRVWRDRGFDLVLSQWSYDRNEDVWEQFHSTGTRNFSQLADPDVDRLLTESRASLDPQQKKLLLRQLHAKVASLRPMIFLFTLDSYAAMNRKVRGVVVHPFYFFTWVSDWVMTDGR